MKIHIYKGEAIPGEWLIFILGGENVWGVIQIHFIGFLVFLLLM